MTVEHETLSIAKVGGNDCNDNQNQPNKESYKESDEESDEESSSYEDPFLPWLLKLLAMIWKTT